MGMALLNSSLLLDKLEILLLMDLGTCLITDGGWFEWTLMHVKWWVVRFSIRIVGFVTEIEGDIKVVDDCLVGFDGDF